MYGWTAIVGKIRYGMSKAVRLNFTKRAADGGLDIVETAIAVTGERNPATAFWPSATSAPIRLNWTFPDL